MRLPRWLREPAVIVALIGLPVGVATLVIDDLVDDRNRAIERLYELERERCDRAFAIAADEGLNSRFEADETFVEEQIRIAKDCSARRK